jgi:hypothetical protein
VHRRLIAPLLADQPIGGLDLEDAGAALGADHAPVGMPAQAVAVGQPVDLLAVGVAVALLRLFDDRGLEPDAPRIRSSSGVPSWRALNSGVAMLPFLRCQSSNLVR